MPMSIKRQNEYGLRIFGGADHDRLTCTLAPAEIYYLVKFSVNEGQPMIS